MTTGLSSASSSVEESVASAIGADPLVFDELGLLNHFVIVDGSKLDTLDVTFMTKDVLPSFEDVRCRFSLFFEKTELIVDNINNTGYYLQRRYCIFNF